MGSTYENARRMGAPAVLRDSEARQYTVDNWSNGTGDVYGYGPDGKLGKLPPDLLPATGPRRYKCCKCGSEQTITTNHIGIVPAARCTGKCRTILHPHSAREKVLPYYGPHKYVQEA